MGCDIAERRFDEPVAVVTGAAGWPRHPRKRRPPIAHTLVIDSGQAV